MIWNGRCASFALGSYHSGAALASVGVSVGAERESFYDDLFEVGPPHGRDVVRRTGKRDWGVPCLR